jgi:hypothetical protein
MSEAEEKANKDLIEIMIKIHAATNIPPPVTNSHEHAFSLEFISMLMHREPEVSIDSDEGRFLSALAREVEIYERKHFPFPQPTKEDLEAFRRENQQ